MTYSKFITVWNNYKYKIKIIKTNTLLFLALFISIYSCESEVPKVDIGDVYVLKQENSFTTIKIITVNKKNISYIPNDYLVSDKEMLISINLPENYTDNIHILPIKEFKKMERIQINTQKK